MRATYPRRQQSLAHSAAVDLPLTDKRITTLQGLAMKAVNLAKVRFPPHLPPFKLGKAISQTGRSANDPEMDVALDKLFGA